MGNHLKIEVGWIQPHRSTQVGAHGALGIWSHQDQATGRGGPLRGRRGVKASSNRTDVVAKDPPQLIVAHPTNKARPAAQLGNPGQGVGSGATRGFKARSNAGVEALGLGFVHQGHGALGEFEVVDQVVVGLHQHVNDGVANADDVVALFHEVHQVLSRARLGP